MIRHRVTLPWLSKCRNLLHMSKSLSDCNLSFFSVSVPLIESWRKTEAGASEVVDRPAGRGEN